MFQTVTQTVKLPENYQVDLLAVYVTVVNGQGKISGLYSVPNKTVEPVELKSIIGIKPLLRFFTALNKAFDHYEVIIENLVAKGEKVMVKYTVSGIQKDHFWGQSPTNKIVKITGLDIFRFDNKKVVEYWNANHHFALDQ